MKTFLTKKRIGAVAVMLAAIMIFFLTGMVLENTIQGAWVSPCKVESTSYPFEIVQVGDTFYLSNEREFTIHVYTSSDGCNWSEVDTPFFEQDEFLKESKFVWRHDASLFNAPGDKLGMAWVVTRSDNKKPRGNMFWSSFDGSTWSEPELLLQRDESCSLDDVMVLEDGALLLLWDEFLVHRVKNGDRTFESSGCDVVYRAYISNDELFIDRTIEPEDPWFCRANGYSFVDAGHIIWCVFEYGLYGETSTIYRSGSEDGRIWSPPEPFDLPDSVCRDVLLTPMGEIGVLDFEVDERNLYLLKSSDWKKWSREKLFRTEGGIKGAWITEGANSMWGFVDTEGVGEDLFFIHSSQESAEEYGKKMSMVKVLETLSLLCIFLLVAFIVSWRPR